MPAKMTRYTTLHGDHQIARLMAGISLNREASHCEVYMNTHEHFSVTSDGWGSHCNGALFF